MKTIKFWLREKLTGWLGIDEASRHIYRHENKIKDLENVISDLVHIGVDVNFKEPHMIIIYSKLKGGQMRLIPAQFDNLKDLEDYVSYLKEKYKTKMERWDTPPSYKHFR